MVDSSKPVLVPPELTERIIGVFFEVYNELGPGFPEFIYRRALCIALQQGGIDAAEDASLPVWFRGVRIVNFRADIVVLSGPVLLEVKAAAEIEPHHIAQALGYLKASEIELALILNFGRRPQIKRLRLDNDRKRARSTDQVEQR